MLHFLHLEEVRPAISFIFYFFIWLRFLVPIISDSKEIQVVTETNE